MGKQSRLVQYDTDYLRHFIGRKKMNHMQKNEW